MGGTALPLAAPQNLLGLAYLAFCFDRVKITEQRGAVFYATKHVRGGMTLGRYVLSHRGTSTGNRSTTMSSATSGSRGAGAGYGCLYSQFRAACTTFLPRGELLPLLHRKVGKSARRRAQLCREYHYHMDGLIVTYWDKLVALKNKYFK